MRDPNPFGHPMLYIAPAMIAVGFFFIANQRQPDLHPAGRVLSTAIVAAQELRHGMDVGIAYGANGAAGPVIVPTTNTVLTENTLVRKDTWELLVRGAWLVPVGTAIEADKNHKGSPIACISSKEKIVVSKKCVRILEYAQVRPPAVG